MVKRKYYSFFLHINRWIVDEKDDVYELFYEGGKVIYSDLTNPMYETHIEYETKYSYGNLYGILKKEFKIYMMLLLVKQAII